MKKEELKKQVAELETALREELEMSQRLRERIARQEAVGRRNRETLNAEIANLGSMLALTRADLSVCRAALAERENGANRGG